MRDLRGKAADIKVTGRRPNTLSRKISPSLYRTISTPQTQTRAQVRDLRGKAADTKVTGREEALSRLLVSQDNAQQLCAAA